MRVGIIGAGVVGALIAREMSRYDVEVLIFEKNWDVGMGITKANSAIVHAGYDDEPGTVRSKFCVPGNSLYTELAKELQFDLKRIGSLVLAFKDDEVRVLEELYKRGEINGVPGLEIWDRDKILSYEPNVNPEVIAALWAPTAGITEPWMVAMAAVENAVENGAKPYLDTQVLEIVTENQKVKKVVTNKGEFEVDVLINAAGMYGDEVAKMAGAEFVPLHPRKGEYILLDKQEFSGFVKSILFPTPSVLGKGTLVTPTVDGGILVGPTAVDLPPEREFREDTSTTFEGFEALISRALKMAPLIDFRASIKTFAGLRPESPQKDFFIGRTSVTGFFNVIAMRSPGLTAAPAIAKFMVEEVQEAMGETFHEKGNFKATRERIKHYADLPPSIWNEEIEKDPLAGKMICFCNKVTEREILEAIKRGARTIDGIKFRTRAMFGSCQGGFCMHRIMKILARELGVDASDIRLRSEGSFILLGKVRK
ncbi:NAD(P)/FAD-dependent oxidoreductase [Fervidobacterium islandicum]|uniref:NAD(P)/FAD-dependent oxidoreductase n=1 Tax=Fervidobacterium islandicum TaxID=2423 RepID=A0AAI8GD62_FERIS|nr:NAD(P)/FAD-dependent oxidoreductase [Fervidobacterium islandicum]AMW32665.1 NAD(P)/FAD-dependent oxidoreductase [Fervidobacterium islandicum]